MHSSRGSEMDNRQCPLVSVVVPTFNRPTTLQRAIESIRSQTYSNLEIIVVNDNLPGTEPDDLTRALMERYKLEDQLRCVSTAGGTGGGSARNFGCRLARGEYLAFLDDDDVFLSDKIETQLSFMVEHDLEMSWQDISWVDDSGQLVEHRRLNHCKDFSREGLLRAHLLRPISPTATYMMKRELFNRTKGFGEVLTGQDWWLMLRCIQCGARIGYMPEVHVHQFLHAGDRLSLGDNKIMGEISRHAAVRGYYHMLSSRDVRSIEFRHNAVLAVSSRRSGSWRRALHYLALSAWASPTDFLREAIRYRREARR